MLSTRRDRRICCGLRWGVSMLLILLLIVFSAGPLWAHHGGHKHVLILHSYHPGLAWTDGIMAGIQEAFAEKSEDFQLHVEYLDTRRYQNSAYFSAILNAILHDKLEDRSFDLVLLSDNEALNFVLGHRDNLFGKTPIVFCGINNFNPSMISGFRGFTGVAESPAYGETFELALRLHPETKEIVIIGNTQNPSDKENREVILPVLQKLERIQFRFWDDFSLDELTEKLGRLRKGSLVFINGTVTDHSGHILSSSESTTHMRQACAVPLYSFWDFSLGHGIVGGKLIRATTQGRLAGQLALDVLQGHNPDEIPVIDAGTNEFMFDYNELKRFGLSMKALPKGSLIINRPPPFYALSKGQLWGGFGLMTVLSGLLLMTLWGRRKAEKALSASEAQIKLLLNTAAEGIYGLDLQGNCTFCNQAALKLLGYGKEEELFGRNMHSLTHHTRPDGSPYPSSECRICQAFNKNEGFHFEDEIFWRADGDSFSAEYWAYPLRKEKIVIGAVVSFLDITERKKSEQRIKEANRELDAFVYTVSHDLRVPLTAMIGFADLLKMEHSQGMNEEALEMLAVIEKQGRRMELLIEDLLALARIGTLDAPEQPIVTDEIVSGVLLALADQLASSGVRVQMNILPDVRVPETLLSQLFQNLIVNAIRYAGAKGNPIDVGGERKGQVVRFYVRDHGPGIPVEEREHIFEVFFRGKGGKKVTGTGVGLATVKKIASLYGGGAWVEETPGGGCTFWVEVNDASSPEASPTGP